MHQPILAGCAVLHLYKIPSSTYLFFSLAGWEAGWACSLLKGCFGVMISENVKICYSC